MGKISKHISTLLLLFFLSVTFPLVMSTRFPFHSSQWESAHGPQDLNEVPGLVVSSWGEEGRSTHEKTFTPYALTMKDWSAYFSFVLSDCHRTGTLRSPSWFQWLAGFDCELGVPLWMGCWLVLEPGWKNLSLIRTFSCGCNDNRYL